jgi:hypothetical protein
MQDAARQSDEYRLLDVKVVRHASKRHRFTWRVLCDGQLVGYSSQSYSTEAEAFRVGNAAAPAIRRLRTASPIRFGG